MAAMSEAVKCPFGREWKVVREIGRGSYGSVYLIERSIGDETMRSAMKVIRLPASEDEPEQLMRRTGKSREEIVEYYRSLSDALLPEIQLMSRLQGDSHIVSYADHQVVPHASGIGLDIYIRMEYLEPLSRWVRGRQLCPRDIIEMAGQLCAGLETCASHKIVHRDIKPDNIFVTGNGAYKLGDFGIAQRLDRYVEAEDRKLGSMNYIAPEVRRGDAFDARADIYGLGMVMYRLLNDGRIPFLPPAPAAYTEEQEEHARQRRLSGDKLPRPAHAGDVLWPVIEKACAYHASARYASAAEFRKALEAVAGSPENAVPLPVEGSARPKDADTSPRTRSTGPNGTELRTHNTGAVPAPPPAREELAVPKVQADAGPARKRAFLIAGIACFAILAGIAAALLLKGRSPIGPALSATVTEDDSGVIVAASNGKKPYQARFLTGDYPAQVLSFSDSAVADALAPGTRYSVEVSDERGNTRTLEVTTAESALYDANLFRLVDMTVYQCDRQAQADLDFHTLMERGRAAPVTGAVSLRAASMSAQTRRWTLVVYANSTAARAVQLQLVLRMPEGVAIGVRDALQFNGSGLEEHLIDLDPLFNEVWSVCGRWIDGDAALELYVDGAFVGETALAISAEEPGKRES